MLSKVRIHNIFIYLTEECNLNCDYCYFKDKRDRTLDFRIIKKFIDFLKDNLEFFPISFEISGGEPFLFWSLVKRTVDYIKIKFRDVSVNIQTNGLLLDRDKLSFIKSNRIGLEIGIDGDSNSTRRHRRGITKRNFNNLMKNIKKYVKEGISICCTMTVHPEEVNKLYDNFIFLSNLGLEDIDITPAAFVKWDSNDIKVFKKEYFKIIKDKNSQNLFIEEDIHFFRDFFLDFSLHPPGYVLCGDVYLCLPEEIRKKYSIFNFNNEIKLNKDALSFYIKKYRQYFSLFKDKLTYRDYVSFGFKIINEIVKKQYLNSKEMIRFHNFLKRTHLILFQRAFKK